MRLFFIISWFRRKPCLPIFKGWDSKYFEPTEIFTVTFRIQHIFVQTCITNSKIFSVFVFYCTAWIRVTIRTLACDTVNNSKSKNTGKKEKKILCEIMDTSNEPLVLLIAHLIDYILTSINTNCRKPCLSKLYQR